MGRPRINDDAQWDQCKERIRTLYINERRTFKEVSGIIADEFEFRPSEYRYHEKLKEWGFRKNLTKPEWAKVNKTTGKRKLEGKESELIISGQGVDSERFRRSTKRYRNDEPCNEAIRSMADWDVVVQTPPPQLLRVITTLTMPWLEFRESFSSLLNSLQHQYCDWNRARGGNPVSLAQNTGMPCITNYGESDINAILDGTQGHDDMSLSLPVRKDNDPEFGQAVCSHTDFLWSSEPTGSINNSTSLSLWMEDIPLSILSTMLEMLADSESDQGKDKFSARFKNVIAKCGEQGSIPRAVELYLHGHKLELAFHIIQICAKTASNNLLPAEATDNLVAWISTSGLSDYLYQLLDLDIPTVNVFKSQVLISACVLGLSGLVNFLIDKGTDVNARRRAHIYGEETPLQAAIVNNRYQTIEILLGAGACPDSDGHPNSRPLCRALGQDNSVQIVELLIKYGATVDFELPNSGYVPLLVQAIQKRKPRLVEILLKAGAHVNAVHDRGKCKTALKCAAWQNDIDNTLLLIKFGADVSAHNPWCGEMLWCDNVKWHRYDLESLLTPVQIACLKDEPKLVKILVEAGADINVCPWEDFIDATCGVECCDSAVVTVLQAAVENANMDLACYLLRIGADINAEGCPFTALQIAAGRADISMVKLLLANGADVNKRGRLRGERTALQAAAETGCIELVRLLLKAGADVNAPACATDGRTALQAAAGAGHLDTANVLLEAGADINAPASTIGGRTCLQAAAREIRSDMVHLLLQAGADPNDLPAESAGLTALQMSLVAIIETRFPWNLDEKWSLDESGNIDNGWERSQRDLLGHSRYTEHEWRDFCRILESLIHAGADVNASASSDSIISTAGLAVWTQNRSCLQYLVGRGLELNTVTECSTAILEAIVFRDVELLNNLVKVDYNLNVRGQSLNFPGEILSPLAMAAAHDDIKVVEMLFAAGAKLEASEEPLSDYTPLGLAVQNLSVRLVQLLLAEGADPNEPCKGNRPLAHFIDQYEDSWPYESDEVNEIVTALLNAGADPNLWDLEPCEQRTHVLLQYVVSGGDLEIAQKLIKAGADVNAPARPMEGRTALQMAAEKGYKDQFQLLRTYNADVNAPPSSCRGVTALQAAAIGGHFDIVVMLLQDGANITAPASEDGRHALEGAAEHGRLDIVSLLLENDDEPCSLHERCSEAAERAAENGHNVIAKLLRERAAEHV